MVDDQLQQDCPEWCTSAAANFLSNRFLTSTMASFFVVSSSCHLAFSLVGAANITADAIHESTLVVVVLESIKKKRKGTYFREMAPVGRTRRGNHDFLGLKVAVSKGASRWRLGFAQEKEKARSQGQDPKRSRELSGSEQPRSLRASPDLTRLRICHDAVEMTQAQPMKKPPTSLGRSAQQIKLFI